MPKIFPLDPALRGRFLRFLISGVVVGVVHVGSLSLFARWWNPSVAFVAAYLCGVAVHYSLNRFWALRSSRQDVGQQTGEYVLTVAASFLLNFLLFQVAIRGFGLTPVWALLLTSPLTTLAVFLVLNFRVFRA